MRLAADSFGSYGARKPTRALRVACALDRAVVWALGIVLALALAVSAYALWDAYALANGGDSQARLAALKSGDSVSFSELLALNPDVCAWITIDNTNIDYPVVRGKDDFEYLSKDATGAYSASGSIFLDSKCSRDFTEPYEVLMGHHMQYGKMFGDLDKFLDEGFFNQNQKGTLYLPDRTLDLQICAVVKADAYDGVYYGTPAGADRMPALAEKVAQDAVFQRDGLPSASDQVVALSTCASSGVNERTLLLCRVTGERAADKA